MNKLAYSEQQNQPQIGTSLRDKLEYLEQTVGSFQFLPGQLDALTRRIASMQPPSERDTPDSFCIRGIRQEYKGDQSPIRLKNAVDSIPKYDGHKMSVFQFCKMCERALKLIPSQQEYYLVQLIINKLYGHAYAVVEGVEYSYVFQLTQRLKEVFGPNKSADQYRGELANIYMKQNEHILDYVERVKELTTLILDSETTSAGQIDEITKGIIETRVRDSFINGLPPDLLVRVKLENPHSLERAVATAIQLTKTLEAESLRKRVTLLRTVPNYRADIGNNFRKQEAPKSVNEQRAETSRSAPLIKSLVPGQPGPNYPGSMERTCYYCKMLGHFMKDCPRIGYKPRNVSFALPNQGNAPSVPVTGVHQDATQGGRPSTNMVTLQETPENTHPASPN